MNAPLDWVSVLIGCTGVGLLALAAGMIALVFWQSRRMEAKHRQRESQPNDEQRQT
ncbi:MAG: hypothetical protein H5T60_05465 [Anaerolineae bacterium]|nr:hypothetical protein [Anaerolineae bacterium]